MKTTAKIHHFGTIKNACVAILFLFLSASIFAQCGSKDKTIQPKIHSNVNRQYDDKGNLIGYDSTYTWSWSNVDTIGTVFPNDSLFTFFNPHWDNDFMNPFSFFDNDSLLFGKFSNPFMDNFMPDIDKQIEEMMKQHEEMYKHFMIQPKPLIPAPEEKSTPKNTPKKSEPIENQTQHQGIDL